MDYPELNDLSVEGLKEFKRARFQKKVNDVLWSMFLGLCFFLAVLWAWNLYQLFIH